MVASPPAAPGRIFISYRREETAYAAGWLYDRLADRFGGGQVFKDVDSIQLGDDFVEVISTAVGSCDVLLALIGDEWLTITDADGRRRLDDPDDFVRVEIEAALTRNVRVIPILVDGARMPRAAELPARQARLVRRQALELSPARFDFDTGRLLKVLDRTLAEVRTVQEDAASTEVPAGKAPGPSTTALPQAPERPEQVERSPTPTIPSAAPATPAAAQPPSDQSKPPESSATALPKAPEQPEQAVCSPPPTIPRAAPAPPARPSPSDSGKSPGKQRRRRSRRAWVLAGAGVGVVLILLIVAIVANSGRTPPQTGTVTMSPPTGRVIFNDDFSSRAYGWNDAGSQPKGGHYKNGAYRVTSPASAEGDAAGGSPLKARRVYPAAPRNLLIEVKGRRLPESDQNMEYGILCRVDGNKAYIFTISDNYAKISKNGAEYKILKEADTPVDARAPNRMQAACASVEGQQAVHLLFFVNGRLVGDYTDTEDPLLTGTVGLEVGTFQAKSAGVAEFDDFVVTQI
jgi:hypothetical protein